MNSAFFEDKRVLLVGNSQALMDGDLGDFIDSFPLVARMNQGNIISNPKAQGTKLDFAFYGAYKYFKRSIVSGIKIHTSRGDREETPNDWSFVPLEVIEDLEMFLELIPNKQKPSTGLTALYYLQMAGFDVHLIGFDWKKTKTYYNRTEKPRGNVFPHDWNKEEKFVKEVLRPTIYLKRVKV